MNYQHNPQVSKWLNKYPWFIHLHPEEIEINYVDGKETAMIWYYPLFMMVDPMLVEFNCTCGCTSCSVVPVELTNEPEI